MKKDYLFLISDKLDVIEKLKSLLKQLDPQISLEYQHYSSQSWTENLESPFLRSRMMGKPMSLPGQDDALLSINGESVQANQAGNVVRFPRNGQVAGQMASMEQIEKAAFLQTIESCRGNLSLAAKTLGVGRATLYRKLKYYGIDQKDLKGRSRKKVA